MERSLEAHLEQLTRRHAELREALAGTGLSGAEFAKLSKEYSELSPIVEGIDKLRRARDEAFLARRHGGDRARTQNCSSSPRKSCAAARAASRISSSG